jgi:hypothetical protein
MSLEKTFIDRVRQSAANMRLPVLSVSSAALNSGGTGYSAPLAVRVGAEVREELRRLLSCAEEREHENGECCLIGEDCSLASLQSTGSANSGGDSSGSTLSCPPETFSLCVAQGWLCRSRPRVVWDRCLHSFFSEFFVISLLLILCSQVIV